MKPNDLEQRLARIPLRPPPAAWRDEILAAARQSMAAETANGSPRAAESRGFRIAWRRFLDALPAPWPVLAGAWALVLALNGASAWMAAPISAATPTRDTSLAEREIVAVARACRAEALGLVVVGETDEATVPGLDPRTPAGSPRPRSDRGPVRSPTLTMPEPSWA